MLHSSIGVIFVTPKKRRIWLGLWAIVLVMFFIGIVIAEVNAAKWDDEVQTLLDDNRDYDEKKNEVADASSNSQNWNEISSGLTIALFLWLGVLGILLVLIPDDE